MSGEAAPDPWLDFWMYSPTHLAVLAVAAAFMTALCLLGLRLNRKGSDRVLTLAWGVVIAVSQVVHNAWWCMPGRFDPAISLPLHLCDVAGAMAAVAMVTRWRIARTLIVFWGLLLSSWGFFAPVLTQGPGTQLFWMFWFNHLAIVATALYEIVAGGFRPSRRDTAAAIGISALYTAAMVILNNTAGEGWNYVYVGQEGVNPINKMGPYPLRLLPLFVGGPLLFWVFGALLRQLPNGESGGPSGGDPQNTPPDAES